MKTILTKTLLLIGLMGCSSPYLMAASEKVPNVAKKFKKDFEVLMKARQEENYDLVNTITEKHKEEFITLIDAIDKNNIKLIKTLLKKNPLLSYMGFKKNSYLTPLMYAAHRTNVDTLTSLLSIDTIYQTIDIASSPEKHTALGYAVSSYNQDNVQKLLDCKADTNIKDFQGIIPLELSIVANKKGIFDLLLPLCADINTKNNIGGTLLMTATEVGNMHMMQKLIDADIDINAQTNEGRTALMSAASFNNDTSMRTLLDAKASIDITSYNGNTALSIAQQRRNRIMEQLLLAEHNVRRSFDEAQADADRAFFAGHQENQEEKDDREVPKDDAQVPAVEPMMPQEADRPQENNPNQPILRKCIGCDTVQMGSKKTIKQAAQESADSQPLFKFCAGCPQEADLSKRSYYCTVECQTKHWPTHKQTCARIDIKDDTESTSEDDQPEDTLSTQKEQCAHAQEGNYDGPCPHCHPDFFCD